MFIGSCHFKIRRVRQVGRAVEGARLKACQKFGKCSGPQLWAWVRIPHLTFETNLVFFAGVELRYGESCKRQAFDSRTSFSVFS